MTNTQKTSQMTVATNYEQEVHPRTVSMLPNSKSPYLLNASMPVPSLALTKTHCLGYCDRCVPMMDSKEFEMGCRSLKTDDLESGEGHREYYSERLVAKAVHLFRNPFDNLVARMHHGIKKRSAMPKWREAPRLRNKLALFEETPEGFIEWCSYLDKIFVGDVDQLMKRLGIAKEVYRNLPCKTELFRYVQWHNNAIKVLDRLHIPVHVLYYEDYTTRYNITVQELFKFLELEAVHSNSPFLPGKTYGRVYTDQYQQKATNFVRAVASPKCWSLIRHYFEPWLGPNVAWLLSYPNSVRLKTTILCAKLSHKCAECPSNDFFPSGNLFHDAKCKSYDQSINCNEFGTRSITARSSKKRHAGFSFRILA